MGIHSLFDFILTSREIKSEKPNKPIFEEAMKLSGCIDPSFAYHIGESIELDVKGAINSQWNPIIFNEAFDEQFPDWSSMNTIETADKGNNLAKSYMTFGRKDTSNGNEWYELWSLDDILYLFGFPEDLLKPIQTTFIKAVRDD